MYKYDIYFVAYFYKKYKKLVSKDVLLEKKVKKTFKVLKSDPFYPSLKTHYVNHRISNKIYSSWVTGYIRILWEFENNKDDIVILAVDIGGHSGNNSVY